MTDFRVTLPAEEDATAELDWEQAHTTWYLSRKYYGEVSWVQNLRPTSTDLEHLLHYFRIENELSADLLRRLSPGELAMIHNSEHKNRTVLASLCLDCGLHWTIYRLEEGVWRAYGRTCDFAWRRGVLADPKSDSLLARMLEGVS